VAIKLKRYYQPPRVTFRAHKGRRHKEFARHGTIWQPEVFSRHATTSIWRVYAKNNLPAVAVITAGKYKTFPSAAVPRKYAWKTPAAVAAAKPSPLKVAVPLTPAQVLADGKKKAGITKGWSAT